MSGESRKLTMSSRAMVFRSPGAVPKRNVRKRLRTRRRVEMVLGTQPPLGDAASRHTPGSARQANLGAGGAAGEGDAITPASMRCSINRAMCSFRSCPAASSMPISSHPARGPQLCAELIDCALVVADCPCRVAELAEFRQEGVTVKVPASRSPLAPKKVHDAKTWVAPLPAR